MTEIKKKYQLIFRGGLLALALIPSIILSQAPEEFQYEQSTLQAFYFFIQVTLNGNLLVSDDWVAAFRVIDETNNGDCSIISDGCIDYNNDGVLTNHVEICVGARQWDVSNCGGGICDVPAQGDDGYVSTLGYMHPGEIPTFKVYDASTGIIYPAIPSQAVDPWTFNGFALNDLLEATEVIIGCTDDTACNYDGTASDGCDDCCEYFLDCAEVCGGNAMVDECGVCDGEGIPVDECDCKGNIDFGCGCGNPAAAENYDCDGNCIEEDCLGECGGTAIADCAGDCNGEAIIGGCDNECGSTLELDECGECGGDGIAEGACDCEGNDELEFCLDHDLDGLGSAGTSAYYCANGVPNDWVDNCDDPLPYCAANFLDDCALCGGDNSCNGIMEGIQCMGTFTGSLFDCLGECLGPAEIDACGVCEGDDSTCLDCADVPNGGAVEDCLGECGGDAIIDICGICNGDDSICTFGCTDDNATNYYCNIYVCDNEEWPEDLEDDGSCLYNYSGTVNYFSDLSAAVPLVEIILNGISDIGIVVNQVQETDDYGNFTFDIPTGYYTITPEFLDNSLYGITAADASMVARTLVGLEEFDYSHSFVAAEVSLDTHINSLDASRIARYSIDYISSMNDAETTWVFDPPFIIINDNTNSEFGSFIATKLGDVSGNWPLVSTELVRDDNYNDYKYFIQDDQVSLPLYFEGGASALQGIDIVINSESYNMNDIIFELSDEFQHTNQYTVLTNNTNSDLKVVIYAHGELSTIEGYLGEIKINNIIMDEFQIDITHLLINESNLISGFYIPEISFSPFRSLSIIRTDNPMKFKLKSNYPNPFNPSTTISWEQPTDASININIYDIDGQYIQTLVNNFYGSGYNKTQWSATEFPSGIYFYILSTGDEIFTGKMVLIK